MDNAVLQGLLLSEQTRSARVQARLGRGAAMICPVSHSAPDADLLSVWRSNSLPPCS